MNGNYICPTQWQQKSRKRKCMNIESQSRHTGTQSHIVDVDEEEEAKRTWQNDFFKITVM